MRLKKQNIVLTITYNQYANNSNILCVEHWQALTDYNYYKIVSNVKIEGTIEELMGENEEFVKKDENSIDILPIIWENILMEIPMRVVSEEAENSDITKEGDGWKFVTEEEEKKSPLSELMDMLDDSEVK